MESPGRQPIGSDGITTSEHNQPERRTAIADAGLAILAEQGGRGLTHRAVDRQLGFPLGTTGNYYPTRDELIRAIATRLLELDTSGAEPQPSLGELTATEAAQLLISLLADTADRDDRFIARLELQLEARRRAIFLDERLEARRAIFARAATVLEAAGVPEPDRRAGSLIALLEGIRLDQTFFEGIGIPRDDLEALVARFIESYKSTQR